MAFTFDGPNRLIILSSGTTTLDVRDMLSRWADWVVQGDNSKYLPALDQVGGNDIDVTAGTKIPIYAYLLNGWRIRPQEANHTLTVSGGVLLVSGGGDPFNNPIGQFTIRVNYQQPVQAISVGGGSGSGSGGLTPQQNNMLMELWRLHGLEVGSPLMVTQTGRTAGGISQAIAEHPGGAISVIRA